jgi:hypothetical protein
LILLGLGKSGKTGNQSYRVARRKGKWFNSDSFKATERKSRQRNEEIQIQGED